MAKKHLFILLSIICCAACAAPPGSDEGDMSRPPEDLASDCAALTECACRSRTGCQVIAEPCYCPFPQCGEGACICGGGRYLGCAPRSSACESSVSCRPAGRIAGPDGRGCYACRYETDCDKAFRQMMETLKAAPGCGISDQLVDGFSCRRNPECLTRCVNAVERCEDVGCGLCTACRCVSPGQFERCVNACPGG